MFDAAKDRYLTIPETALRLGVSPETVRRSVWRKELGHVRLGSSRGRILITETMIDRFLQARTVEGEAKAA